VLDVAGVEARGAGDAPQREQNFFFYTVFG
jgi:hypothetical protein